MVKNIPVRIHLSPAAKEQLVYAYNYIDELITVFSDQSSDTKDFNSGVADGLFRAELVLDEIFKRFNFDD